MKKNIVINGSTIETNKNIKTIDINIRKAKMKVPLENLILKESKINANIEIKGKISNNNINLNINSFWKNKCKWFKNRCYIKGNMKFPNLNINSNEVIIIILEI